MAKAPNLDALAVALSALPGYAGTSTGHLSLMAVKGLAHDHVSVRGRGLLLRVPKQSQFALSAVDNLTYQAACFMRVSQSGHAPRLHGMIPPKARIPMGALLVDQIEGRPPRLPDDLPALAEALARIHALPMPHKGSRAPLAYHEDPVGGAMKEIEAQAAYLDEAQLTPAARAEIDGELAWARAYRSKIAEEEQPVTLVLTDTHPGNFLIEEPEGGRKRAVIVDLEKALYGSPGTDLAHATIYSSTTWDPDVWADLSLVQVAGFYKHYLELAGENFAERLRPWLVPMRRITMLRAITWCVKWRVLHQRDQVDGKHEATNTEDWSAENSDPALIAHVAGRVEDYLSAATLQRMRAEWLDTPTLETLI